MQSTSGYHKLCACQLSWNHHYAGRAACALICCPSFWSPMYALRLVYGAPPQTWLVSSRFPSKPESLHLRHSLQSHITHSTIISSPPITPRVVQLAQQRPTDILIGTNCHYNLQSITAGQQGNVKTLIALRCPPKKFFANCTQPPYERKISMNFVTSPWKVASHWCWQLTVNKLLFN